MPYPTDAGTPHAPEAEKRQATIVKCDIVGSTRINQSLDLDGQLAFKRGWEELVTAAASRYGGHLERFEGDGALLAFGYPDAREDAPECAVRMALAVMEAVRGARFVPNVRLQVRIGIATGVLAVLKRAHVAKSEAIAGTTIDLAERLRAAAEANQIVISDATKRLAGRYFHYQDLGRVRLKGFAEDVLAWRVVRESAVVSRFEAQRVSDARTPIVGRGGELARLQAACDDVLAGGGRAICLRGDAGMGKSRLAAAVLERAADAGAVVLEIDCTPSTRNSPMYPIGVLLQRAAGIGTSATEVQREALARQLLVRFLPEAEVDPALHYLGPLLGLEAPAAHSAPDEVRDRTIETVVAMLRALSQDGPLALLCEDLHWVDDTTAQVLERIRAEVGKLRALLIVTTRPGAETCPVNMAPFEMVELEAMGVARAAEMVRAIAGNVGLDDSTVQRIVERCEGVPLVLEEVTREALDAARRPAALAHGESSPPGAVPAALVLVVQSRLARWPDLTAVAQAAAVLGREFSVHLLEQMVPYAQREDVQSEVDVLMREGLLAPADSGAIERAQFKHAMICEAVYNTLLTSDRQRLHSHAANLLLAQAKGAPDAAADVLAEHLRKAGRLVEAIHVRLDGSADTLRRGSYVEAEGHCEAGLAMIDSLPEGEERRILQFKLLLQLGVALTGKHGYSSPRVETVYRRAQSACGETDEAGMLYPILRGLAALNLVRGNLAAGHELSERAMAVAERSQRPEFRIDALSVHCYAAMYYRGLAECRSWIDRCLALYRQESGERLTYPVPNDAGVAAMAILPTVEWLMGDSQACESAIAQGLRHVEDLGRDFDRAYMHAWVGGVRMTQRRFEDAMRHSALAIQISERNGYREWHVTGLLIHLLAQASLRPSPEALQQAGQVMAGLASEGVGLNASWYLWGLARWPRPGDRAGDGRARPLLGEAAQRAAASGETRMDSELLMLQAELEAEDGAAVALLRKAMEIADQQEAVANTLRAAAALVARSCQDGAAVELARSTTQTLDGCAPYPEQRAWMADRLAALRHALAAAPTRISA